MVACAISGYLFGTRITRKKLEKVKFKYDNVWLKVSRVHYWLGYISLEKAEVGES